MRRQRQGQSREAVQRAAEDRAAPQGHNHDFSHRAIGPEKAAAGRRNEDMNEAVVEDAVDVVG